MSKQRRKSKGIRKKRAGNSRDEEIKFISDGVCWLVMMIVKMILGIVIGIWKAGKHLLKKKESQDTEINQDDTFH